MKKLIALLLALTMVFGLFACGKKDETSVPSEGPLPQDTLNPEELEPDPYSYTFTQFGDAKLTILGAEFIKDDYDEDVLRIYYDYTNTSDTASYQYPSLAVDFMSITQDGEECDHVTFGTLDDCAVPEDLNCDSPVQPGLTSRQTMLIECDPNGGVVEVSCYVMIGNWVFEEEQIECFTFQLDPKDLPDVPAPLELAPIMEPTYAAGLPSSGTNENGDISIDGMELTTGDNGENVLRVKMTVTNNGEEASMPMSITNGVEVYQDGFALRWFSPWDLDATEADDAYEMDLEPGETVQCNALFLLRNDHPVEIVIEDLYSEVRLGMIGDVKALLDAAAVAGQAAADAASAEEAAARKALVGTWLQRDSDWEDTYYFYADGTGLLVSGPEYPFTYTIKGDVLTVIYDDDDEDEFTFTVEGDLLTMVDMWDEELLLDRQAEEPAVEETEAPTEAPQETEAPEPESQDVELEDFIIGTWAEHTSGYEETFTFKADGTGVYYYTDGSTWEFTFTYTISGTYVDIRYDDGDIGGFYTEIVDENTIMAEISGYGTMELVRE